MTEDIAAKFEAAWDVFARTCSRAVAPEATFQAWFAHYLISQFGIDRVVREINFKHLRDTSSWKPLVPGGEVKLDAVVLRAPGVDLPHYAHRGGDRDGMHTLGDLAVISELKVSSTQGEGLSHGEVAQDVYKLSLLLKQAEDRQLTPPLAYLGILDNHPRKTYRLTTLEARLAKLAHHEGVRILYFRP